MFTTDTVWNKRKHVVFSVVGSKDSLKGCSHTQIKTRSASIFCLCKFTFSKNSPKISSLPIRYQWTFSPWNCYKTKWIWLSEFRWVCRIFAESGPQMMARFDFAPIDYICWIWQHSDNIETVWFSCAIFK